MVGIPAVNGREDVKLMKFRLNDGSTRAHGATVGNRDERVTGSRVTR
jgi:hypothetical protein